MRAAARRTKTKETPVLDQLSALIQTFVSFIPHLDLLKSTHGGVKFKRGGRVVQIKPGLYWWWPATTEVAEIPVVKQAINLTDQVIPTAANGKPLSVSGVIVYTIFDPLAALSKNHDVDETIAEVARAAIMEVMAGQKVTDLKTSLSNGELSKKLTSMCKKRLREFGVAVQRCNLTDFTTCVAIKMIGQGQSQMLPLPVPAEE
jgi:regulator of protease activity HflC (stomatin/prohibitin superfamily)